MISLAPTKRNQFLEIENIDVSDKRAESTVKYISSIYPTTKCFVYAEIYKVTLFKFKLLGKRKAKDEINLWKGYASTVQSRY